MTALCTAAAFALIGCGIYAAVCQLCIALDLTERDPEPFGCDFGDVHSEEY